MELPLEMLDTEQGDFGLETQQESDTSDEDTQDTQAAAATTQKGKDTGKGKADKRSKKQKLMDFLCNKEIIFNKHLMDYKDRSKSEAVSFVRRTICIKMAAKSGSRANAHFLGKSHT